MQRICVECDTAFDLYGRAKKLSGGLSTQCPECSEEPTVRALGFASGDGKMASLSIVKPATEQDARALKTYWFKASGMNKGKSCNMHNPGLTSPQTSFTTVSQHGAMNHKGKM